MRTSLPIAQRCLFVPGLIFCAALSANAQYSNIFNFTGSGTSPNQYPNNALIADSNGDLYGTTGLSVENPGGVFELTPAGDGSWTENLYGGFVSSETGISPIGLVLDPNTGNLYGATSVGGTGGCGVIYELTPPSVNNGEWSETVLYNFACGADGNQPYATLIRDSAGRLYGTTLYGGSSECNYCGVVFMLTPPQSGGAWTEQVLHTFLGNGDGGFPSSALVMDSSGAIYGVTPYLAIPNRLWGTAFKLTPTKIGPWAETVLHRFYGGQISNTDGGDPIGPLAIDSSGAVYGATRVGGEGCPTKSARSCGTIFQLVPPSAKGGQWTENLLYQFTGETDGASPMGGVVFNSEEVLYGSTSAGGKDEGGTVFSLSPPSGGVGNWTIASFPLARPNATEDGVLLVGNDIFGASTYGGANRVGMVFELQQ